MRPGASGLIGVGVGLLVACGAVSAAAASASLTFAAPVDLSAPGQLVALPQVAADAQGDALAVWEKYDGTHPVVQGSERPVGGAFGAPIDISWGAEPQVAFDASGEALAASVGLRGTNAVVQVSLRPAGGAFAAPVDISPPGQRGTPLLALSPSGAALVVWQTYDGTDFVQQGAYRAPGGAFAAPVDIVHGSGAQVALDPAGDALVVSSDAKGPQGNAVVQAAFRPAGGSFAAPFDVSPAIGSALDPHVAMDGSGNGLVVWTDAGAVRGSFRPRGGMFAPPVDFSAPGAGAEPRVAFDASGNALVVWERITSTTPCPPPPPPVTLPLFRSIPLYGVCPTYTNVVQASWRPVGGTFAAPVDVSAANGFAATPQVTFDASGNALVVWDRGGLVQGAYRPVDGTFDAPVDLSSTPDPTVGAPRAAFDRSGSAFVVWDVYKGNGRVVQAAIGSAAKTDATGPPDAQSHAGSTGETVGASVNRPTVLTGSGEPASTLGSDGDFYLDTTDHRLYGPKSGGAWPSAYVSVSGAHAAPGPTGATGLTGLNGANGRTGANGANGARGLPGGAASVSCKLILGRARRHTSTVPGLRRPGQPTRPRMACAIRFTAPARTGTVDALIARHGLIYAHSRITTAPGTQRLVLRFRHAAKAGVYTLMLRSIDRAGRGSTRHLQVTIG